MTDAPQQWFVCDDCEGYGNEVFRIWVYEHGCGFGHDDTDEQPCPTCGGLGGWYDDAAGDEPPAEDYWYTWPIMEDAA